jgi:hypothetical protein
VFSNLAQASANIACLLASIHACMHVQKFRGSSNELLVSIFEFRTSQCTHSLLACLLPYMHVCMYKIVGAVLISFKIVHKPVHTHLASIHACMHVQNFRGSSNELLVSIFEFCTSQCTKTTVRYVKWNGWLRKQDHWNHTVQLCKSVPSSHTK